MNRRLSLLAFLGISGVLISLNGCGGAGTTAAATPQRVSIVMGIKSPNVNLAPGGTHDFKATISGTSNTAMTWTVIGGEASGSISATGSYTAPKKPGVYQVEGKSVADPNVKVTATVTVTDGINLTINEQNLTLKTGDDVQLTAAVSGGESEVLWSVSGGDSSATVSESGVFTAPDSPGSYTITASSKSDPEKKFSTTILVSNGLETRIKSPIVQLIAVPSSTVNFTAKVVGAKTREFKWTADSGTIVQDPKTKEGTWTAPEKPGIYTIKAVSVTDPSKLASQTIKVVETAKALFKIDGKGSITVELNLKEAPKTVARFVTLVNGKHFDGAKVKSLDGELIRSEVAMGSALATLEEKSKIKLGRGVIMMSPQTAELAFIKSAELSATGSSTAFGAITEGQSLLDTITENDVFTSVTIVE